ncbi:MAG TPA: hypothetical protein VHE99_06980 [Gammaproteobacteria bacterium]|nr:hypothetical protein [Gammaproteobacteria bacterium]
MSDKKIEHQAPENSSIKTLDPGAASDLLEQQGNLFNKPVKLTGDWTGDNAQKVLVELLSEGVAIDPKALKGQEGLKISDEQISLINEANEFRKNLIQKLKEQQYEKDKPIRELAWEIARSEALKNTRGKSINTDYLSPSYKSEREASQNSSDSKVTSNFSLLDLLKKFIEKLCSENEDLKNNKNPGNTQNNVSWASKAAKQNQQNREADHDLNSTNTV